MARTKEEHASYMREYTRKNRDRINQQKALRREANRPTINWQKRAAYRRQHPQPDVLHCRDCQVIIHRDKAVGRLPQFCDECQKIRTRQAVRRFQQSHREDELLRRKRYREANHAKILQAGEKYRESNRDRGVAYTRNRWATDPEYRAQCVTNTRNRRAKKRGNGGSHTQADIEALYRKQKGKCGNCRVALHGKYHVDHVMPIRLGGSNGPENLQLLCPSCNRRKSGKDPIEWAQQNGKLFC